MSEMSESRLTLHPSKIVDGDRQLLALDPFDNRIDLGVAGGCNANLRALVNDMAVDEFDFGAASLEHVLAHGGTLQLAAAAAGRFLDENGIDLLEGCGIAVARQNQLPGIELADLFELIAQRLADPHRFTADLDRKMADVLVLIDFPAGKAGGGRHAIAHGVVTKLRPSLAPEI